MPIELDKPLGTHFDVLIVGAGLAGISAALLIKRRHRAARVLLVEQQNQLPETGHSYALAGVSSVFMSMALRATDVLAREHLPRHGEHFWFARDARAQIGEMTEIGADEFASHPAHHVDIQRLARRLLLTAQHEGVQVLFGHQVTDVQNEWPQSTLRVRHAGQVLELQARWVIDAAGDQGLLAGILGLQQPLDVQPSWSAVANWTGVLPFDELSADDEDGPQLASFSRSREFATHHFFGEHWRASVVPHVGGGASVHLNMERDAYLEFRGQRTALEAYSRFVRSCPGLRELLRDASVDACHFQARQERDWTAKERCRRGWFLVGEAAGTPATIFGERLDSMVRTVWNAAEVISLDLAGSAPEAEIVERLGRSNLRETQHDQTDRVSLRSTTRALCGDAALCTVAYSLRRSVQSLEMQRIVSDHGRLSHLSWHTLWQGRVRGTVYGRLRELARRRQASGHYANRNAHGGLRLGPGEGTLRPLAAACWQWLQLEYASLREAMSPVPGDSHESPGVEVQRRAAEFRLAQRAGTPDSSTSTPK